MTEEAPTPNEIETVFKKLRTLPANKVYKYNFECQYIMNDATFHLLFFRSVLIVERGIIFSKTNHRYQEFLGIQLGLR